MQKINKALEGVLSSINKNLTYSVKIHLKDGSDLRFTSKYRPVFDKFWLQLVDPEGGIFACPSDNVVFLTANVNVEQRDSEV